MPGVIRDNQILVNGNILTMEQYNEYMMNVIFYDYGGYFIFSTLLIVLIINIFKKGNKRNGGRR